MDQFMSSTADLIVGLGGKIVGAVALSVVGKWAFGVIGKLAQKALAARKVDPTLVNYMLSVLAVSLNLLLLIATLGVFGIENTSFAAVFAAAGVAIGMAWSGLLSNFAAGVMMIVLRPFKVGDIRNFTANP
ncbi:MAG: small conductance mechanosensitive channel [Myxococcota bacterium]|jgi:small conductance mechanosensitive channel